MGGVEAVAKAGYGLARVLGQGVSHHGFGLDDKGLQLFEEFFWRMGGFFVVFHE
jgi:hypothetical protein